MLSSDGAFATLSDTYVVMQEAFAALHGVVATFFHIVIRRGVRLVDGYLCRYAKERSLLCMAM